MTEAATFSIEETACTAENKSRHAVAEAMAFANALPASPAPAPIETVDNPFDIQNLRYHTERITNDGKSKRMLTPQAVTTFVEGMNNETFIAETVQSGKMFAIGVGTGGTICMSPSTDTGRLAPEKDFRAILEKADPDLLKDYQIAGIDAYAIDSSEMTIGDEGDLVIAMSHIWEKMDVRLKRIFAGFLVTHGTDTMPRSGAHMLAMFGEHMPFNIVHTGAQRPIGRKNNDARVNIPDSLYMLEMLHRGNCAEAVTVMGRSANLTAGITKVSDEHERAMTAFMHREIVDFGSGVNPSDPHFRLPEWLREKPQAHTPFYPVVYRGPNRVGEFRAEMEEDPQSVIMQIRHARRLAFLVTTYGASTFDPPMAELIGQEVKAQNLPTFAVSPVNADPKLSVYEVGEKLVEAGVKPLYMTVEFARAKLMRSLAIFYREELKVGGDFPAIMLRVRQRVEEAMARNLVGEIPTKASRRKLNNQ